MEEETINPEEKPVEFIPVHTTCANGEHEWHEAGEDVSTGMRTEVCTNCWLGRTVPTEQYT